MWSKSSTSVQHHWVIKPAWRDEMKLCWTFDAGQENDGNDRNQLGERARAYFKAVADDGNDQNACDYSVAWWRWWWQSANSDANDFSLYSQE